MTVRKSVAKKITHKELTLALFAVIFSAAAVLMLKMSYENPTSTMTVAPANTVLGATTAGDMMKELKMTEDDGGAKEFEQLRNAASGL